MFPVAIALLVPTRSFLLPKLFGAEAVDALDGDGGAPIEEPVAVAEDVEKGKESSIANLENGNGSGNAKTQETGEKEMPVISTTSTEVGVNPGEVGVNP